MLQLSKCQNWLYDKQTAKEPGCFRALVTSAPRRSCYTRTPRDCGRVVGKPEVIQIGT